MIRRLITFACLALATCATPAFAVDCKPDQRKLHGKCVSKRAMPVAAPADPFASLKPAPTAKTQPEIGQKVRSGDSFTDVWHLGRKRSGFEGTVSAPVVGATLRNIKVTDPGSYGISFCRASHVVIDGFQITRSEPAKVPVPTGIGFGRSGCGVTGADITIANGIVSGFVSPRVADTYWNGDGVAVERYDGVSIVNVIAENNADAGFDLKSTGTWLDRTTARANGRNYRFWGDGKAGTITSEEPRGAHVWVNAKTPQSWTIAKLIARSKTSAPILRIENNHPVSITIERCDLSVPAGTQLLWGGRKATVTWGPGCEVRR
jgi:hypothetical protein